MTTLLHERGTLGFALTAALEAATIRKLARAARQRARRDDPVVRDAIAREWIELQALRFTNYRSLTTLMKTGMPGPGGIGREAALVGGEPAADEARARAARPRRAARRRRTSGRLLAVPAAALPRQHDRGRHVGDPAQHHRRARPRPAEVALMDFAFSEEQEELRREARAFLAANPDAPLVGARRARLARRLRAGGARRRRALGFSRRRSCSRSSAGRSTRARTSRRRSRCPRCRRSTTTPGRSSVDGLVPHLAPSTACCART